MAKFVYSWFLNFEYGKYKFIGRGFFSYTDEEIERFLGSRKVLRDYGLNIDTTDVEFYQICQYSEFKNNKLATQLFEALKYDVMKEYDWKDEESETEDEEDEK